MGKQVAMGSCRLGLGVNAVAVRIIIGRDKSRVVLQRLIPILLLQLMMLQSVSSRYHHGLLLSLSSDQRPQSKCCRRHHKWAIIWYIHHQWAIMWYIYP